MYSLELHTIDLNMPLGKYIHVVPMQCCVSMHFDRVCHLAGELVEGLKKNSEHETQSVTIMTRAETLCVKIAALCYNLGKNCCCDNIIKVNTHY